MPDFPSEVTEEEIAYIEKRSPSAVLAEILKLLREVIERLAFIENNLAGVPGPVSPTSLGLVSRMPERKTPPMRPLLRLQPYNQNFNLTVNERGVHVLFYYVGPSPPPNPEDEELWYNLEQCYLCIYQEKEKKWEKICSVEELAPLARKLGIVVIPPEKGLVSAGGDV